MLRREKKRMVGWFAWKGEGRPLLSRVLQGSRRGEAEELLGKG